MGSQRDLVLLLFGCLQKVVGVFKVVRASVLQRMVDKEKVGHQSLVVLAAAADRKPGQIPALKNRIRPVFGCQCFTRFMGPEAAGSQKPRWQSIGVA